MSKKKLYKVTDAERAASISLYELRKDLKKDKKTSVKWKQMKNTTGVWGLFSDFFDRNVLV